MHKPSGAAPQEPGNIVPSLRIAVRLGLAASALGVGWLLLGAAPAASAAEPVPTGGLLGNVSSALSSTVDAVTAPVSTTLSTGGPAAVAIVTPPAPAPAPAPRPIAVVAAPVQQVVAPVQQVVAPVRQVVAPVTAPVTTAVSNTISAVAGERAVSGVVTPVTGVVDGIVGALPITNGLLGPAPIGSIVDPVTGAVDDLVEVGVGIGISVGVGLGTDVVGPLDGLDETLDLVSVIAASAVGLENRALSVAPASARDGLRSATASGSVAVSARSGIVTAAAGSLAVTSPAGSPAGPLDRLPALPSAPLTSSSASQGSTQQAGFYAALDSTFGFTLASAIRSSDGTPAIPFSLSFDPGSSPD